MGSSCTFNILYTLDLTSIMYILEGCGLITWCFPADAFWFLCVCAHMHVRSEKETQKQTKFFFSTFFLGSNILNVALVFFFASSNSWVYPPPSSRTYSSPLVIVICFHLSPEISWVSSPLLTLVIMWGFCFYFLCYSFLFFLFSDLSERGSMWQDLSRS